MAERKPTEPEGEGSYPRFALEADCYGRHVRSAEALGEVRGATEAAHRRIDGLVGIDGGRGRVGELEKDMQKTAEILAGVAKQMEKIGTRNAIMWAAATGLAAIIAAGIVKLVLGGV